MIHGSGPNDYNELGIGSKKAASEGFFHRFSKTLIKKGYATVRYNKRSYEMNYVHSAGYDITKFENKNKIYNAFIKDVDSIINKTKTLFPNKNIYLLGHSQGAGLALQVAHKRQDIEGVVL